MKTEHCSHPYTKFIPMNKIKYEQFVRIRTCALGLHESYDTLFVDYRYTFGLHLLLRLQCTSCTSYLVGEKKKRRERSRYMIGLLMTSMIQQQQYV